MLPAYELCGKNHILYILLCYLNVNCVLNVEQNVNIIPARIFVEKYIAYMVFISFYRLEGILKPSMILNFINDKIYTKKIKTECCNRSIAILAIESGFWLLVLQDRIAI